MADYRQRQYECWNGVRGEFWVQQQSFIDDMLRPFEDLLIKAVRWLRPRHVLDVGCGNGTTTLSIARSLAPGGRCTGVDLSKPMIENARSRLTADVPASFLCADAQEHRFERPRFDALASRFGVMFLGDPIAAFRNLRSAVKDQAGLAIVVWRQPADEDFMVTAQHAAAPFFPEPPPRDPDAPGPFLFGDRERVGSILEASGWTAIDFEPVDLQCSFPSTQLDMFIHHLAPLGAEADTLDEKTRARMLRAVRDAYDRFVEGDEVRFTGRTWLITGNADSI